MFLNETEDSPSDERPVNQIVFPLESKAAIAPATELTKFTFTFPAKVEFPELSILNLSVCDAISALPVVNVIPSYPPIFNQFPTPA